MHQIYFRSHLPFSAEMNDDNKRSQKDNKETFYIFTYICKGDTAKIHLSPTKEKNN